MRFILILIYLVIFFTGAAGLIYEVTWQKYLSRLLGSDSMATAIILGTFLGGLSFGYYLCGKITTWVDNHFKAYAVLEGIIGAWCLFFPAIFKAVESSTQYWSFSPPAMIIVQGLFCSALLMGIPTICMGGTIPLLTRGISKNVAEATRIHAKVYAINTTGAFLGTLLAGFYLIPKHGLPLTIMGTACINLSAFVFFYFLSTATTEDDPSKPEEKTVTEEDPDIIVARLNMLSPRILYAIAFLSGFYVMTLENVLIRITNLSIGSSSYSFSLIVSVFILSIAIGSYVVGRLKQIPDNLLFLNQLFITLFLLVIYVSLDTWPYWAHIVRITFQSNMVGFWCYYAGVFLVLTMTLILPVGFMGATVPIAFHEIKRDLKNVGKHSGILFSLNTIGNLTGSLIGGIVFYYLLGNAEVFLTAVWLAALSTCLAGWHLSRRYFLPAIILIISIFIFSIFTPFYSKDNFTIGVFRFRVSCPYSLSGPTNFFKELNKHNELKFYQDGPTATVGVIETPLTPFFNRKPMSIIVNGKSDSSTLSDIYTLRLLAHIPALLAENRKDVMIVGVGTGVTAGELTLYPEIERIDIAEISPSVVKALPYFHDFTYNVHKNPKVRVHIGDAFRIIGRSRNKWDIIISEPSNPWVTGVDSLYTQEFYGLVKDHLTKSGILVQWIHTYSASPLMLGMVINTVQKEFSECCVFIAGTNDLLIVASNKHFSAKDVIRAEKRLNSNKQVKASLESIDLNSIDSILIRQIWPYSYVADNFWGFGIQSMDFPRLHYLAGKSFFIGHGVPYSFLFNSTSAPYFRDFLIAKHHENWMDFPFAKEAFDDFFRSADDKVTGPNLTLTNALKLKAYLSNSDLYPLSEEEKKTFMVDLIPFITNPIHDEKDWEKVNLKGTSFRRKAELLLKHINQFRNWIVPYPIEGLKRLLQEGSSDGINEHEKNWCTLQHAKLLLSEKIDKRIVKQILDQAIKGPDGNIILQDQDKILVETVNNLMNNSNKTSGLI